MQVREDQEAKSNSDQLSRLRPRQQPRRADHLMLGHPSFDSISSILFAAAAAIHGQAGGRVDEWLRNGG